MDILIDKINELSKIFMRDKAEDQRYSLRKLENENIYFIQQGYNGPIKIGISKTPFDRIEGLQPGNPYNLRLLFYYAPNHDSTTNQGERFLHKRFAKYQVNREWFYPVEEILLFMLDEISSELRKLGRMHPMMTDRKKR